MKSSKPINDEPIDNIINVNDNIIVELEARPTLQLITNSSLDDITVLYDCVSFTYVKNYSHECINYIRSSAEAPVSVLASEGAGDQSSECVSSSEGDMSHSESATALDTTADYVDDTTIMTSIATMTTAYDITDKS